MGLLATHLLSAIVFVPLLGALILLAFPRTDDSAARGMAMTVALVDLALTLYLWAGFDSRLATMQFTEQLAWVPSLGIGYSLGVDGLSILLVVLTGALTPLVILSTYSSVTERVRDYMICLLFLQTGMLGAFLATDLFLFYVFWEVMLVPMYFLIGIWGGRRRVYATLKFFLYTMAGSLLMLVAILYTVWAVRQGGVTFSWAEVAARLHRSDLGAAEVWLFAAFAVAFAIKVPMFPFHTWLPDAHVEAPTGGSVILAGVLLKLGTFGFLRYAFWLFPHAAASLLPAIAIIALIGIVYGALVAMVQTDLKRLVAYSSVSHLGFVMLGLSAMSVTAVSGGVLQMVNHGVSTGALFLLVGVIYERRHTRLLEDFGGIAKPMPRFAAIFVIMALSSIGLPGLNGFVGEFLILLGAFKAQGPSLTATTAELAWVGVALAALLGLCAVVLVAVTMGRRRVREQVGSGARLAAVLAVGVLAVALVAPPVGGFAGGLLVQPLVGVTGVVESFREIYALVTVLAATGVILAAVYLLYAVQRVFFGPIRHPENEHLADLSTRELAVLIPLVVAAFAMGLFPGPMLRAVEPTVTAYTRDFRALAGLPAVTDARPLAMLTGVDASTSLSASAPAVVAAPGSGSERALAPPTDDGGRARANAVEPGGQHPSWMRLIDQRPPARPSPTVPGRGVTP